MPKYSQTGNLAYGSLDNPSNQIRLLRLKHDTSSHKDAVRNQISVEVWTYDINCCPDYVAISYTWGDACTPETIVLNGRAKDVTWNCWYALWLARFHGYDGFLWIDAICIDQLDDNEKSFQVGMMGQIYSKASEVLLVVGSHEDDSSYLFMCIQEWQESLNLTGTGVVNVSNQFRDRNATSAWFSEVSRDRFIRIAKALRAFQTRRYFTRLWVVQEICLAKSAVILCGDSYIDFDYLLRFIDQVRRFRLILRRSQAGDVEDIPSVTHTQHFPGIKASRYAWHDTRLGSLLWCDMGDRSLLSQICSHGSKQCADRRDKVFGLLGLVDWHGLQSMVPNYADSSLVVALHALSYSCLRSNTTFASSGQSVQRVNSVMRKTGEAMAHMGIGPDNSNVSSILLHRRGIVSDARCGEPSIATLDGKEPYILTVASGHCFLSDHPRNTMQFLSPLLESAYTKSELNVIGRRYESGLVHQDTQYKVVTDSTQARALVPCATRAGDMLLWFQGDESLVGLVARKDESMLKTWRIVGQALFLMRPVLCPGGSECSCGLSQDLHQVPNRTHVVKFSPLDLLLLVCQDANSGDTPSNGGAMAPDSAATLQPDLTLLRLDTGVVRNDNPMSSYVEECD